MTIEESIAPPRGEGNGEGSAATREERGIALFRDRGREIVWYIDGTFGVPSRTHEKVVYSVDLRTGSCTCPDHIQRGARCQHIYAARLKKAETLAESEERMAEIRRRSSERRRSRTVYSPDQAERLLTSLERMGA